jgi:hypothetical protein
VRRTTTRAGLAAAAAVATAGLLTASMLRGSPAGAATTDLACGRPASSNSGGAANAVDCAAGTVWQSGTGKPQQLQEPHAASTHAIATSRQNSSTPRAAKNLSKRRQQPQYQTNVESL